MRALPLPKARNSFESMPGGQLAETYSTSEQCQYRSVWSVSPVEFELIFAHFSASSLSDRWLSFGFNCQVILGSERRRVAQAMN
jgi:hypothetical protein